MAYINRTEIPFGLKKGFSGNVINVIALSPGEPDTMVSRTQESMLGGGIIRLCPTSITWKEARSVFVRSNIVVGTTVTGETISLGGPEGGWI